MWREQPEKWLRIQVATDSCVGCVLPKGVMHREQGEAQNWAPLLDPCALTWSSHTGREEDLWKLAWWHSVTAMVLLRLKFCRELTMSYRILWGWKFGSPEFHEVAEVIRDKIYDICDMVNPNCLKQNVAVRLWDLAWGTFCQEHAEHGPVEARGGEISHGAPVLVCLSPNVSGQETFSDTQFLPSES